MADANLVLSTQNNSEIKDFSTILPNQYLSNHRSNNTSSNAVQVCGEDLFRMKSPDSSYVKYLSNPVSAEQ